MSLCDTCYSPGYCCKKLQLSKTFWDDPKPNEEEWTPQGWLDSEKLPFIPLKPGETFKDEESGRFYSKWLFNCKNLLPNGRCGDYENRPEVCRNYEPRTDGLCCHYHGEGINISGEQD